MALVELPISDTEKVILPAEYTLAGLTINSYRPVSSDHDVVIISHAGVNELMIFNGVVKDMNTHLYITNIVPII